MRPSLAVSPDQWGVLVAAARWISLLIGAVARGVIVCIREASDERSDGPTELATWQDLPGPPHQRRPPRERTHRPWPNPGEFEAYRQHHDGTSALGCGPRCLETRTGLR